jgi:GT2 family glycosyltransferase
MSTARLFVRAVVVTDGRSPHLEQVLKAVADQTFTPDAVHVAIVGDGSVAAPAGLPVRTLTVRESASFGDAVDAVLAAYPSHDAEYIWFLHDDSAPMPDVLERLAATARKRSRAAIVGAAQVRWRDTSRLISLGSTVSRSGARRVDLVDDNDINQGQYDWRDDVLAVSIAGALVRREVWTELGGFDATYGGFGDSADFCRRAWRAGHDVVVVPAAHVRHVQMNLRGTRDASAHGAAASYVGRRTGEWYHALVWGSLLAVPFLVLWAFGSSVARALLRIAQNQPRMAWAELGVPWRLLARLPRLPVSRFRARRRATVPARAIRALLATNGAVIHNLRTRYLRAYDRWRIAVTPSAVERAELAAAGIRRRWMLGVVVVTSAGLSTALFGSWVPDILAGRMLSGRALGVTDVGWHELWQRAWTGFSEVGYGAPSLDGAFALTMVPLAVVPGGLRTGLGLVLALGVVCAAVAAWFAAGAATRAVSVRAIAALAYAAWPPFLVAISQGRVGAVIAHIVLPFVALGLARALGRHRGEALAKGDEYTARRFASPSAAAAASLALALAVAAAPALLVPSLLALALVAALAGRRWLRVALVAVPALMVAGPGLVAAARADSVSDAVGILWREMGPSTASSVASPISTMLTLDTSPGGGAWYANQGIVAAIAITVCLGALLALLSGRAAVAVRIGWVVASLGLATAFIAQRVVVSWPDGAGSSAVNGFAGPGLSLALLGALAACTAAASGVWFSGGFQRLRRVGALVVATAAAVAILTSAAAWAWPGRPSAGDVQAVGADVLPLVAALAQEPPALTRVLTLTDTDDGVAYAVESTDGAVEVTGSAGFDRHGAPLTRQGATSFPTPAALAEVVATLVGAGVGAEEQLATWGIGVIVATPDSPKALSGLEQVDTLELMGASARGTAYRVVAGDVPVTRAWVETVTGTQPVSMTSASAQQELEKGTGGTLVIAVPADDSWFATLDGTPLKAVEDAAGRQAFAVPATGGIVAAWYSDSAYRAWWWAAAIACGLALLASAPIGDRRMLGVTS